MVYDPSRSSPTLDGHFCRFPTGKLIDKDATYRARKRRIETESVTLLVTVVKINQKSLIFTMFIQPNLRFGWVWLGQVRLGNVVKMRLFDDF